MEKEGTEFAGSIGEFLAEMEDLTKQDLSCVLVYEGREIGAVISMGDYAFLQQATCQEAEAEAKQAAYYADGEHRPEPWIPWSEQRRLLAAEVVEAGDAPA